MLRLIASVFVAQSANMLLAQVVTSQETPELVTTVAHFISLILDVGLPGAALAWGYMERQDRIAMREKLDEARREFIDYLKTERSVTRAYSPRAE